MQTVTMPRWVKLRRWAWVVVVAMISAARPACARADDPAPEPGEPFSYVRVTEESDGAIVKLQTAVREFKSQKPGAPVIYLVGAVHIADKGFYEALQESLDKKDVVLFEGVRPPGSGRLEHQVGAMDDAARTAITKKRLRFTAMALEIAKLKTGAYPQSLDELTAQIGERLGKFASGANSDGWGHPLEYRLLPATLDSKPAPRRPFELYSVGADGIPSIEGPGDDIRWADQKPLDPREIPRPNDEGIQKRLARALGVVFQLDAMQHDKPNWRSSDLSADQVQERLEASGADASALFNMLSGSSFSAKLAGALMDMIAPSKMLSTLAQVAMIDVLSRADRLLEMQGGSGGAGAQMAKAMGVIIKDRNQVVEHDLKRIIADEPAVKTIAVIYGAGHMADLEPRVRAMGYEPARDVWFTAMRCDVRKSGMSLEQVNMLRTSIRESLAQAMTQMEKRQPEPKKGE